MRSHPWSLLLLTFAVLAGRSALAQPPEPPPAPTPAPVSPSQSSAQKPATAIGLVEFDAIQRTLAPAAPGNDRPGRPLRLLDTRPRADYDAGHLPLAVWVDSKQAQAIAARPGGLDDASAWAEWIAPLGLIPDQNVVVLDGGRQLEAARVWWLLRYLGVERVGLVDGNIPLWVSQGRPTTNQVLQPEPTTIAVRFRRERLATRDDVLGSLRSKDARIVDARTIEEWTGQTLRSKRGGHMPTACRLEYTEFVNERGQFLPRDQIEAKVAAAGIKAGEPVIAHCQGGGRASVDAFVFEMLGHPTRNYYLSWGDWGNAADTPIEGEPTPEATKSAAPVPPPASAPEGKPDQVRPPLTRRQVSDEADRLLKNVERMAREVGDLKIDVPVLKVDPLVLPKATPATEPPVEAQPFTVEYGYKAKWGHADEFLALFRKNHLPILRERQKAGDILSISMSKPRIHTGEADRWDFRVTLVFKSPAEAFHTAADEPIKQRLFPDQSLYKAEEQRRFEILEAHTDLPIEAVPLD